nr:hypothetical protein GCM10010200_043540 [Actinomadura rugatobispora]
MTHGRIGEQAGLAAARVRAAYPSASLRLARRAAVGAERTVAGMAVLKGALLAKARRSIELPCPQLSLAHPVRHHVAGVEVAVAQRMSVP